MKKSVVNNRSKQSVEDSLQFKKRALSVCIAAAISTQAGIVQAQSVGNTGSAEKNAEESLPALEEVVVTGFRRSLMNAISVKRNSSGVVEAISAEDIGKLPDSSIAESIARLPGLAAQRLDGRSSSVSVRGLGENFSATTFNGREQVSIGDNRGVEFDLYPSEIMSGVTVYKSADASLTSQGIAGVIDLRTIRPLEQKGRTLSFSGNLEKTDIGKLNPDGDDQGHRATVSYVDQFADGTIGVALALATMKSPNGEERWEAWGYPQNGNDDFVLGGAKPFVRTSTLERDTIMAVIQYDPSDDLSITADVLIIDFLDEKILRGIEIPAQWGTGVTPTSVSNGFVTAGVINDAEVVVRNDFEQRDAQLNAYGFNLDYRINDSTSIELDISHSDVERTVWSLETYAGTGRGAGVGATDDIAYTQNSQNGVQFSSNLDYSDTSLIELGGPLSWGNGVTIASDAQDGFLNIPSIEDELDTIKLAISKDVNLGVFTAIEAGVYYSDRAKTKDDTGIFLTLPEYPATRPIPEEYSVGTVSLDFIGMGDMVAYDAFRFWQDGNYDETLEDLTVGARSVNDWTVEEKVTTLFAKVDFETEFAGKPLTGNLGVQIINTDQSSIGKAVTFEDSLVSIEPSSGGDEFTDVLPSLNMNLALSENQKLRFAVSETLSRSRMDRMNAGLTYGFDSAQNVVGGAPFTANGGNPELEPNRARQYDISYEWYFSDQGYLSAALFYKDLLNWQFSENRSFDIADLIDASALPDTVLSTEGVANLWVSADGGEVSGIELTGSLPGETFADSLEGFGVILSGTLLDSKLDDGMGNEIAVPGLSDSIINATVYYEKGGFQVRTSMRKRDDFLGERFENSFVRKQVTVLGAQLWDAQLSYDFADSNIDNLTGLTVSFQAQNLTEEPYITVDDSGFVRDHQEYGRTFMLGMSYKF